MRLIPLKLALGQMKLSGLPPWSYQHSRQSITCSFPSLARHGASLAAELTHRATVHLHQPHGDKKISFSFSSQRRLAGVPLTRARRVWEATEKDEIAGTPAHARERHDYNPNQMPLYTVNSIYFGNCYFLTAYTSLYHLSYISFTRPSPCLTGCRPITHYLPNLPLQKYL